jgi:hypothetical protein
VRATDHQRLGRFVDGLQRLVRRARSPLFFSVITVLTLVILLAHATSPDAEMLGIYSAEDGDDASLGLLLASEALPPTSIPPLRATDAGTPVLGDCWSARVARTLTTIRDRAPPRERATGRNTIPAPPSVPVDSMCPPALVVTDPVVASFHQVAASIQKLGDGLAMTQEGPGLVTGGQNRMRRAGGRSPPRSPPHIDGGVTRAAEGDLPNTRGGDDERGQTA